MAVEHQDSVEMDRLAKKQDNGDKYFSFDKFCGTYCWIWKQAFQFEATFFNVLIPQIDCHACQLNYLMNWQIIVQALRNLFRDADTFREFFIFWKYVYFFFEDV